MYNCQENAGKWVNGNMGQAEDTVILLSSTVLRVSYRPFQRSLATGENMECSILVSHLFIGSLGEERKHRTLIANDKKL